MTNLSFSVLIGIIASSINLCSGQSMWDLGTVPFGLLCTKVGLTPDMWWLPTHCITYNGTVGCFDGMCKCNQDDTMYFEVPSQRCVGKVGAFCSAEHSTVFHDKQCTPNADCIPIQGEGYSVGKCECLYGFRPSPTGKCEVDPDVSEEDRSTPRPTTTTQPPAREEFKLPPISLATKYATLGEGCQPEYLLNRTVCDTHSRTVSCQNRECLCNLREDSVFDEELDMCVGLVGTWCLARGTALGYKVCVPNADCELEEGKTFEEGYSFGTCKCVYGYDEDEDGYCVRDENIEDPATPRIIATPKVTTVTPDPSAETTTVEGGDGNSAAHLINPGNLIPSVIAVLFMVYHNL